MEMTCLREKTLNAGQPAPPVGHHRPTHDVRFEIASGQWVAIEYGFGHKEAAFCQTCAEILAEQWNQDRLEHA